MGSFENSPNDRASVPALHSAAFPIGGSSMLWNPDDTSPTTFEDPVNQPHETPDAISGYSVLCSGHSFLSDGRLLVVGGGYGPHSKAKWGYKFDPTSKTWKGPPAAWCITAGTPLF